MARVYIETTIPSFYHDTRESPEISVWREATRRWWDEYRAAYDVCTSIVTLGELEEAPDSKSSACLAMLRDVPVLDVPAGIESLVDHYVDQRLMPRGADAAHLAMASLHGVDFMLTWNCRHLANANKVRHLSVLNARLGLACPVLTTPLTLIPEAGQCP